MTMIDPDVLEPWARKYIWWDTPEHAAQRPMRVIAQVMDIGDYNDVQTLIAQVGEPAFRQAIEQAEPGQFHERSWAYWHHRLGLAPLGRIPPAPQRHFT